MPDAELELIAIFAQALERTDPAARADFLDRACGDDAALRRRVEALLAAHNRAGQFSEPGSLSAQIPRIDQTGEATAAFVPEVGSPAEQATGDQRTSGPSSSSPGPALAERPEGLVHGQVIAGRYTLLDELGEGGMGTVYRAAQTDPVKRHVALKLIKVGMDSRAVLARFDAERQALALMDHPNIARVFDGGTTAAGQPFFVMELVKGEAITRYCDRLRLPVRARLELFVSVCQAVQHAHQKGIIHRDLKPSNVMVTEVDGRPTPKVIDFGVAKATEFDLTEESLGDTGAIVGTPAYMSPEQADPGSMDIDTRTDVYALGVILYELLAGSPPLDASQFKRGAILEMLRMVREVDPPKPSTKVSTADALPSIAASRRSDPALLKRELKGDLDWIVMKSLEKDRTRRYETASGFAADVLRHLAYEPVLAAPPSQAYRTRKFVRKHRGAVIAAGLVLTALLAGFTGTTWGLFREARANASLIAANAKVQAREQQAIDAVKKFRDAVASNPRLKNTPELQDLRKTLLKEPLAFFRDLRDRLQADRDTRPESLYGLAQASHQLGLLADQVGDKQDALAAYQESTAVLQKLADSSPAQVKFMRDLAVNHNNIANLLSSMGKPDQALQAFQSAISINQKLADSNPGTASFTSDVATTYNNIGVMLAATGKLPQALQAHERALAIRRKLADSDSSVTGLQNDVAVSFNNIGVLLRSAGKPADALKAFGSALALQQKLADSNPGTPEFQRNLARSHGNIGSLLADSGDPAQALEAHQKALAIFQNLADSNPTVTELLFDLATSNTDIGNMLNAVGKPEEALKAYQSALLIRRNLADANPTVPKFTSDLAMSHYAIANLLGAAGKPAQSFKAHELALVIRQKLALEHPESADFASNLGASLNNLATIDLSARRFDQARVRLQQAVKSQRMALASNPANATYRQYLDNHLVNLITALRELGQSASAAEAQRELVQIRDSDPAFAALDARLRAILKGTEQPRDEADRLSLAQRAYSKTLYATAARLWTEALEANPSLGDDRRAQHRYNAACAAVLACTGNGNGDPPPSDASKVELRQQALDWLNTEVAAWSRILESGAPQYRPYVAETLKHWQEDPDLAGIRDDATLAPLPEKERAVLKQLWTGVDRLLKKAEGPK